MYFVMNLDNRGGPALNVRQGGYIHKETAIKKAKSLNLATVINDRRETVAAFRSGRELAGSLV